MAYDERTALVVVDMQNDFADPQGALSVRGGEDVVAATNVELARAVAAGAVVVYTQDWHPESTPHFVTEGGTWPVHCVGGTWGAELHPALDIVQGAHTVRKGTGGEDGYSAFSVRDPRSGARHATVLEGMLREKGVEKVVVVGLATDYCVKETALDALRLGFGVEVPAHAVAAVDLEPGDGDKALAAITAAGGEVD
jgi:nicotinamidase/pyrazinamidase